MGVNLGRGTETLCLNGSNKAPFLDLTALYSKDKANWLPDNKQSLQLLHVIGLSTKWYPFVQ